mgnify:CR=1 FL=1
MSQIKLLHSGGNGVSIVAPDSNPASDRTLKLPSDGDGTILTTNSATGKILQVVTTPDSDRIARGSLTVNNWTSITGLSLAITPSSNTSKIKLSGYVFGEMNTTPYLVRFRVKKVISGGATSYIRGNASGSRTGVIGTANEYFVDNNVNSTPHQYLSFSNYIDSPATTSAVTYTIEINYTGAATWYYNRSIGGSDGGDYEDGISWITLEEIAA